MLHSKLNLRFDMSALTSVYSTKEMSLSHRLERLLDLKREAYTLTREDMARTVSGGNEKLSRLSVVGGIAGIAAPQPYEVSKAAGVPRHARQSHLSLFNVLAAMQHKSTRDREQLSNQLLCLFSPSPLPFHHPRSHPPPDPLPLFSARSSLSSFLIHSHNPRMLQSLLRCGSLRDVDANQPLSRSQSPSASPSSPSSSP